MDADSLTAAQRESKLGIKEINTHTQKKFGSTMLAAYPIRIGWRVVALGRVGKELQSCIFHTEFYQIQTAINNLLVSFGVSRVSGCITSQINFDDLMLCAV